MEKRVLYFDCFSGISGDMTIGALLDLGVDFDVLESELKKLNIKGYSLLVKKAQKNGITGVKFDVVIENDHDDDHDHHHEKHQHSKHSHHHHEHKHEVEKTYAVKEHHHRTFKDIKEIIDNSEIDDKVKELSKNIFYHVAEAEGKVHDKPLDEVHFHEVGAIDSIVDIVGTAICINQLDVDEIYSSPVHLGTGFVKSAHGIIPVPAPATMEILKGVKTYSRGVQSELTTPTGAAIIKELAEDFIALPGIEVEKVAYGLGTKDLEIPNMLRVILGKKKLKKNSLY